LLYYRKKRRNCCQRCKFVHRDTESCTKLRICPQDTRSSTKIQIHPQRYESVH